MPTHEDDTKRADSHQHDALLADVRVELDAAAEDVEHLNQQLRDRTRDVQRLEILVDKLLELVEAPTIVVDPNGRVAAVSRGAADHDAHLSREAVGKSASAVVPQGLADGIMRIVETEPATTTASSTRSDPASPPEEETHRLPGATAIALPDRSILVLLDAGTPQEE